MATRKEHSHSVKKRAIIEGNKKVSVTGKKRILFVFAFLSISMVLLLFRVAWIQVINGEEYTDLARDQQTSDVPVTPDRGTISDRNGELLASNATCYTVWIRPAEVRDSDEYNMEDLSVELAVVLNMDASEILEVINSEEYMLKLAVDLDKDTADNVTDIGVSGIDVVRGSKRFYPEGKLAATVIGSVDVDGNGRSGIEFEYNEYLSGVDGRWVMDTDVNGKTLSFGLNKYYDPQHGYDISLTIDKMLQSYLETAVENGRKNTDSEVVAAIAMDPKTGEILAMAVTPGFDPNSPTVPANPEELETFSQLSLPEQSAYLSQMWRNPLINNVYEPGSTLKLITSSTGLETGIATPDTPYYCTGKYQLYDREFRDAENHVHGDETLTSAVGNSCNLFHIELALKMGYDVYYEYISKYGLLSKTGIDYPAESMSIVVPIEYAGPVELATMGFGQGIAITPMQLITAISAIGNDGNMMRPHFLKSVSDSDGNLIYEYEPEIIRSVISEETADEMLTIMELQVSEFGGRNGRMEGYRIGGKTGTAEKVEDGVYTGETDNSFVCLAPIDDPKIAVLSVCYSPDGYYADLTAIPIVKEFLQKALPHMGIEPNLNEDDNETYAYLPDITGMNYSQAVELLDIHGLKYEVIPELSEEEAESENFDFTVVDQYPKAGNQIRENEVVYIYR